MGFVDIYRRSVMQKQKDIAELSQKKSKEQIKHADINKRIATASEAIRRTSSVSVVKSKTAEIERYRKEIANISKRVADFEEKIARKYKELHSEEEKLAREERREIEKQKKEHAQAMRTLSTGIDILAQEQRQTRYELEKLKVLPKQITVLFLAANPLDVAQLRLDEEARLIREQLRLSDFRDSIKFESRWAVRPSDILLAINECRPTIIHFSGHSSVDGELVLQDMNGRTKLVSIQAMAQTLNTVSDDIRFLFINSCFSYLQAESAVKFVEGAIGMKTSISDDAARIFAAQFYSAIGFGRTVANAFEQAKSALMLEGIREEETPELFLQEGVEADKFILVEPEIDK